MNDKAIPITINPCEDCEALRLAELGRELADRENGDGDTSDAYTVEAVKYVLEHGDDFIKTNLKSQVRASMMNVLDREALQSLTKAYDLYRDKCSVQAREISQLNCLAGMGRGILADAVEAKRAGQTQ